jgi:hypothetical protein
MKTLPVSFRLLVILDEWAFRSVLQGWSERDESPSSNERRNGNVFARRASKGTSAFANVAGHNHRNDSSLAATNPFG